jgi:hypothetical protein
VNRVRRRPDGEANPIKGEKPSREAKTAKSANNSQSVSYRTAFGRSVKWKAGRLPECTVSDGLWEESKQKVNKTDKYYPV